MERPSSQPQESLAPIKTQALLSEIPEPGVSVRVSAYTEYALYVNGQKVGFGPPISDPRRRYFDFRNIQPYLRKGHNAIAARVDSLATATEDTKKERGWFILDGTVLDGGREVILDTGPEWKCLVSDVWQRDAPRQSWLKAAKAQPWMSQSRSI